MGTFLDVVAGRYQQIVAIITSSGAADANKIAQTGSDGRFHASLMPVGIGADTHVAAAGENLTAGDFVYVDATGEIRRASANVGGNDTIGFVLDAFLAAASATIYFEGRNTSLSGLTPGSRYYLSDSTSGGVTATPVSGAGKTHQYLGTAVTATTLAYEAEDGVELV